MSDHPRTITLPAVQLPVLETDVLVAGAGTAGCIAAIAAARQGASVILIENCLLYTSPSPRDCS